MTKKVPVATFLLPLIILTASVVIVSWLLETVSLSMPVRLAVAMVPPALLVYAIVVQVRMIRQSDELVQRIYLETLAIAFSSLFAFVLVCEYLRKAGFLTTFKPDYVLVMMLVLFALGFLISWRRYQ